MVALRGADINKISQTVKLISKNHSCSDYIRKEIPYLDTDKIVCKIKQKQKRLNDDEITELIEAYKSGLTVYQCAEKFGCHRTTVSMHLKANNVKIRRQPLSEKQINEAKKLYKSGLSYVKIGNILEVDAETVRKRLVQNVD